MCRLLNLDFRLEGDVKDLSAIGSLFQSWGILTLGNVSKCLFFGIGGLRFLVLSFPSGFKRFIEDFGILLLRYFDANSLTPTV